MEDRLRYELALRLQRLGRWGWVLPEEESKAVEAAVESYQQWQEYYWALVALDGMDAPAPTQTSTPASTPRRSSRRAAAKPKKVVAKKSTAAPPPAGDEYQPTRLGDRRAAARFRVQAELSTEYQRLCRLWGTAPTVEQLRRCLPNETELASVSDRVFSLEWEYARNRQRLGLSLDEGTRELLHTVSSLDEELDSVPNSSSTGSKATKNDCVGDEMNVDLMEERAKEGMEAVVRDLRRSVLDAGDWAALMARIRQGVFGSRRQFADDLAQILSLRGRSLPSEAEERLADLPDFDLAHRNGVSPHSASGMCVPAVFPGECRAFLWDGEHAHTSARERLWARWMLQRDEPERTVASRTPSAMRAYADEAICRPELCMAELARPGSVLPGLFTLPLSDSAAYLEKSKPDGHHGPEEPQLHEREEESGGEYDEGSDEDGDEFVDAWLEMDRESSDSDFESVPLESLGEAGAGGWSRVVRDVQILQPSRTQVRRSLEESLRRRGRLSLVQRNVKRLLRVRVLRHRILTRAGNAPKGPATGFGMTAGVGRRRRRPLSISSQTNIPSSTTSSTLSTTEAATATTATAASATSSSSSSSSSSSASQMGSSGCGGRSKQPHLAALPPVRGESEAQARMAKACALLMLHGGFEGGSAAALEIVADAAGHYVQRFGRVMARAAESQRFQTLDDVVLEGFHQMGGGVRELQHYLDQEVLEFGYELRQIENRLYEVATTARHPEVTFGVPDLAPPTPTPMSLNSSALGVHPHHPVHSHMSHMMSNAALSSSAALANASAGPAGHKTMDMHHHHHHHAHMQHPGTKDMSSAAAVSSSAATVGAFRGESLVGVINNSKKLTLRLSTDSPQNEGSAGPATPVRPVDGPVQQATSAPPSSYSGKLLSSAAKSPSSNATAAGTASTPNPGKRKRGRPPKIAPPPVSSPQQSQGLG